MTTHASLRQPAATSPGRTAEPDLLGTLLVAFGRTAAGHRLVLRRAGPGRRRVAAAAARRRRGRSPAARRLVACRAACSRCAWRPPWRCTSTSAAARWSSTSACSSRWRCCCVYRDWRPIVGLRRRFFAVHHVAFDRMQAAGMGVVLHAGTQLPEDRHARRLRGAADGPRGVDRGAHGRHRTPGRRARRAGAARSTRNGQISLDLGHVPASHGRRAGAQAGAGAACSRRCCRCVRSAGSVTTRQRRDRQRQPRPVRSAPSRPPAACSRPPRRWSSSPAPCARAPTSARQANQLAARRADVAAARRRGGRPGGRHHGRHQRQLARRSPTSSASSTASPSRPTSWR